MYLDIVILVVLVLAILDGLKNGLFVEFLSVFGLIINFVAAKYFTPILMEFLKFKVNETNYFIIYIIIFWAVYIVMGIFLHFLRNIMDSQNKGFILRILGGLIGSIKGAISFSFPHLAEPYSSPWRNFFPFFPLKYTTAHMPTAAIVPATRLFSFMLGNSFLKANG